MSNETHIYQLPGEVAAALSTNRPEMMTMLINKVKAGHTIEQVHIIGVLEAFRDIIKMRADDHQRAQALERHLHIISDASKGLDTLQAKILRAMYCIGSGEPLSEDELD